MQWPSCRMRLSDVFSSIQCFLGFSLRICFMRLCPSPGSTGGKMLIGPGEPGKREFMALGDGLLKLIQMNGSYWALCSRPLHRYVMLDSYNSWSRHQVFHFCKPKLSFLWGRRKILRERGNNPLVFSSKSRNILSIQSRHRGFTTLHLSSIILRTLFGPGRG